jgi:hypothetical protein
MQSRDVSGREELVGKSGSVVLESPTPDVVVVRFTGHVSADLVPGVVDSLERAQRGTPIDYFFDAWELHSYDSQLRTRLTSWFAANRKSVRSLHTVTKSKIVKMGIGVANVVLGFIIDHADRASFDRALALCARTKTS